jgi:hypothetical protein
MSREENVKGPRSEEVLQRFRYRQEFRYEFSLVISPLTHFASTRARTEEIELVAEYEFSVTSQLLKAPLIEC